MVDNTSVIVLFGPPGAGKGTQAEILARRLNLLHISTGDLLRDELARGTELGKLAKSYMESGELVPDEVVARMVAAKLSKNRGAVLDGFPRTVNQAEILQTLLAERNVGVTAVVEMQVADETVVRRLSSRYICSVCQTPYNLTTNPPKVEGVCDRCGGRLYQREDDRPETVMRRLRVYREQTEPVVEYYRRKGVLVSVEAEGPVEEVTEKILSVLSDPL